MERSLIFLFCLGISLSVSAQMSDLLGNLAIQGQMTAQGISNYNAANIMNQKNNIAQELQIQLIESQTKFSNFNHNVSRETIHSPALKKYNTTVQKSGDSLLFELH